MLELYDANDLADRVRCLSLGDLVTVCSFPLLLSISLEFNNSRNALSLQFSRGRRLGLLCSELLSYSVGTSPAMLSQRQALSRMVVRAHIVHATLCLHVSFDRWVPLWAHHTSFLAQYDISTWHCDLTSRFPGLHLDIGMYRAHHVSAFTISSKPNVHLYQKPFQ
jgi:hypothetical protein